MNINTATAFVLNNLFIIAAGGLIAAWLGWRIWQKVEGLVGRFQSWKDLGFWAVKLVFVVAVLFRVGGWIFTNVNSAVVAAVNSPSVQQSGQAIVGLGAAVDHLIGWDGSTPASGGGMLTADYQVGGAVKLLSSVLPAVQEAVDNATFTAPDGKVYEVVPPSADVLTTMHEAAATINNTQDWSQYTIRPGDSMGAIAARYGLNLNELCGMNASAVRNCGVVRTGQTIKLPTAHGQALREVVPVAKPVIQTINNVRTVVQPTRVPAVEAAVSNGAQHYTIKSGDNIYAIAGKFGGMTKVYDLCKANRATLGDNCDQMTAGATIIVK